MEEANVPDPLSAPKSPGPYFGTTFRASKIMLERALAHPKVKFLLNTVVEDVYDPHKKCVTGVRLHNLETDRTWDQEVDRLLSWPSGHPQHQAVSPARWATWIRKATFCRKGGARTNTGGRLSRR